MVKSAADAAGCKRHGGAGRGAHFRLQGGAFGERGYLVATMKEYTISDMGASTHFFISEALFGDWGGFAARAKEKHRFYRTDANLAES